LISLRRVDVQLEDDFEAFCELALLRNLFGDPEDLVRPILLLEVENL